jgi:hypothetical protein
MNGTNKNLILVALLSFVLFGCTQKLTPSTTPSASTLTPSPPTPMIENIPATITPSLNFNIPYMGPDVAIQENNSFPKYKFISKPSKQLVSDNRIGSGAYSSFWQNDLPNWESILNQINNFSVKRLDTSLPEVEEPIFWDWSETEIPQEYDCFIDGLNENDVAVNYLLHFWDKEGHANGERLSTPRFKTDEQIQNFLDYVRLVVSHFKGRIQYYTIWSEPDNCGGEQIKCIEPDDYINLLRQTVPVIRQEDPEAKVALAPISLFFDQEYLLTVLKSDIMSMVDVVQWHGTYIVVPGSEFYGNYYYEYPLIIEEIKQTAIAHGFDGEYWGTEISYCSEEFPFCHAPDQPWGLLETDKLSAKYYARWIVVQLGMDVGTGLASFLEGTSVPWAIPTIRNLYTIMAGTIPINLPVKTENEPPDTVTYTFMLPNDDLLLAIWTDGIAVENDPSESTTLILPEIDARTIIEIDPLYGFEQELVTETDNGDLIIRNLLVKDYPIIIRFIDPIP